MFTTCLVLSLVNDANLLLRNLYQRSAASLTESESCRSHSWGYFGEVDLYPWSDLLPQLRRLGGYYCSQCTYSPFPWLDCCSIKNWGVICIIQNDTCYLELSIDMIGKYMKRVSNNRTWYVEMIWICLLWIRLSRRRQVSEQWETPICERFW